jgi:hypothetical protein
MLSSHAEEGETALFRVQTLKVLGERVPGLGICGEFAWAILGLQRPASCPHESRPNKMSRVWQNRYV